MEQSEIILVQAVTLDLVYAATFYNNLTERLLDETAQRIVLLMNTHRRIRGLRGRNVESSCRTLKREGAKALLDEIDQNASPDKCNFIPLLLTELRMRELYTLLCKQGCMGKRNGPLSIIDAPLNPIACSIFCMHLEMFTKKLHLRKNARGHTKRAASSITLAFEVAQTSRLYKMQQGIKILVPRDAIKNAVDFVWIE